MQITPTQRITLNSQYVNEKLSMSLIIKKIIQPIMGVIKVMTEPILSEIGNKKALKYFSQMWTITQWL